MVVFVHSQYNEIYSTVALSVPVGFGLAIVICIETDFLCAREKIHQKNLNVCVCVCANECVCDGGHISTISSSQLDYSTDNKAVASGNSELMCAN